MSDEIPNGYGDKIKQLSPAADSWFCVVTHFDQSDSRVDRRWAIGRVAAWAVVECDDGADRVFPIDNSALPITPESVDSLQYVYGPDNSPWEKSWGTIYREITPRTGGARWIPVEMMAELDFG